MLIKLSQRDGELLLSLSTVREAEAELRLLVGRTTLRGLECDD